jgi:hypothetical protein
VGAWGEADVASGHRGRVRWVEVRCCSHSESYIHG